MTTYAQLDQLLRRNDKPVPSRKVANNTYAQRRPVDGFDKIAIRLHQTDILTFEPQQVTLDTGGWFTVTTKERMNRFLPVGVRLSSHKGRWTIHRRYKVGDGTWAGARPYADGMSLVPSMIREFDWVFVNTAPLSEVEIQDAHNRQIERLLTRWLRDLTDNRLRNLWREPICPLCIMVTNRAGQPMLVGEAMGDTQHLIDHLVEREYPTGLLAYASLLRNPSGARVNHLALAKADVRAYLRSQLRVGAISTRGSSRAT